MEKNTKGAIEFEKLAMIVIVLAVMAIALMFFSSGFRSTGATVGEVGQGVQGQKGTTTGGITSVFTNIQNQWKKCRGVSIVNAKPCTVSVLGCTETSALTAGTPTEFCKAEAKKCTATWTDAPPAGECTEAEVKAAEKA